MKRRCEKITSEWVFPDSFDNAVEECEQKLNTMIEEVKARIKAEKELDKHAT